jgi:hypothetical protein
MSSINIPSVFVLRREPESMCQVTRKQARSMGHTGPLRGREWEVDRVLEVEGARGWGSGVGSRRAKTIAYNPQCRGLLGQSWASALENGRRE